MWMTNNLPLYIHFVQFAQSEFVCTNMSSINLRSDLPIQNFISKPHLPFEERYVLSFRMKKEEIKPFLNKVKR
jgi:hypothetical protein